jgi:hypothetical protein
MPKVTRTYGPFHFEDLDPHRFEDLIRGLAGDFKEWQSIEATGRGGADDGIDIRAFERSAQPNEAEDDEEDGGAVAHPMFGNRWIFQCKREKEIGPKRVRAITDEVDDKDPPYGYVLAAPANFSKASYDAFRGELTKKGVMEFYMWGKPELETMLQLPKNDRVLFTFFGISLVSRRRSRSTEIRGRVTNKNKLLRAFGDGAGRWPVLLRDANDDNYPFEDKYADFDKNPRWKRFEARRLHPHGLIVRQRQWYAYVDIEKMEFDFTERVSLVTPSIGIDDINNGDWEVRQREREVRDAVEDFWDHLPNQTKAEYCRNAVLKFEDMLVIDEKGIAPDKCPHIFADFGSGKGPFSSSFEFFEVRRGYGAPEKIPLQGFKRIKVFPDKFAAPTIGTVHAESAVQLDEDTHRLVVNGNESIKEFYAADKRYKFLKPRDIFALKNARDNELKYFQVTHTRTVTVGERFKGDDKDFRIEQLGRQLGKELKDADVLQIVEFKLTYVWRIERLKGQLSERGTSA